MRILHVTAQKPDSTGSGVYLSQVVGACARLGHEQAVVCGVDAADVISTLPADVPAFAVRFNTEAVPFPVVGMSDVMPYESTLYRDMSPVMVEQFLGAFAQQLDAAVAALQPDVIVCNHLYLLTAFVRERFPETPVWGICHSTCLRQLRSHGLERERILRAIPQLDGILSLHDEQAAQIAELFGVAREGIRILGTGYDARVFNRGEGAEAGAASEAGAAGEGDEADAARSAGAAGESSAASELEQAGEAGVSFVPGSSSVPMRKLVYVGKIARAKGVPSLVRALERLPYGADELRLHLVGGSGSPDELAEVERLAAVSRYDVRLLGKVSTERLVAEYRDADVFVLPSFYEGLPLVTIEAMACGCRVVVSDLPGIQPWTRANVPDAPVWYVAPPAMEAVDRPVAAELPAFEERLAAALREAMESSAGPADVSAVSWDALAARLVGFVGER
ncbi:MAG: glycosyltransferase family 4 protein [Coriobacteriia bacterium]|nr:glycosyltransferase family 4 protein [Coriobacteriia bacterium]